MTGPNSPVLSILETAHDPYFVQHVKVNRHVTKYTSWSVTDTVLFFNGISLMLFADKER